MLVWSLGCDPAPMSDDSAVGDSGVGDSAIVDSAADGDAAPDSGEPPRPLVDDDFSYVARAALDSLNANAPSERGNTWDIFGDIGFGADFVIQTPPEEHWGQPLASLDVPDDCPATRADCDPIFEMQRCASQADCTGGGVCRAFAPTVGLPTDDPAMLCVGHSDQFLERIYGAVSFAVETVDVTSLSAPDGRFEATYRNALTALSYIGAPVRVRFLFGNIFGSAIDTDAVLASLTRDMDPASPMVVSVGAYRVGVSSWNHSKIIAVDSEILIEGGHNYYTQHYLRHAPIHDVTLSMGGPTAILAARFANPMWDYVCEGHTITGFTGLSTHPSSAPECPEAFTRPVPAPITGGSRVIGLGRLGGLGDNPSDAALVAMLDSAQTRIDLSLQDLGPLRLVGVSLGDWPAEVLGAFGRAMARGVDVRVVLSTDGSLPGGLVGGSNTYGNGWSDVDAATAMLEWLEDNPGVVPSGMTARQLVCERFGVATLRASSDDAWPNGATLGNHAKYFMVDDLAFYVGSQNLYDANLAELGVIVDDPAVAREIRDRYFAPMWEHSRRVAVSGSDATACAL